MKTLVIGDIHHKFQWAEDLIAKTECDEVVFVGDYFDDFGDSALEARRTAYWLKESLKDPKRKHCIGNHDMPYLVDVLMGYYDCPGFTPAKREAIRSIITKEEWKQLVPAVYTQGWLISHAGFTASLAWRPVKGFPTAQELVEEASRGLIDAKKGNWNCWFVAGYRMATPWTGGCTWAHWDGEFQGIDGIPQIVGHTPASYVKARRVTKTQTDYCIDCHGAAAILITDGKAEIIRTGIKYEKWK